MFPFFIEALQDLKTSETVESFKQMGQILLLLEDVINEDIGFKLDCLNRFIDPNDQDAKGPEDMIKILKKGDELSLFYDEYYAPRSASVSWREKSLQAQFQLQTLV